MNYKNPIFKSKKKKEEEIDISNLDYETQSKIINETQVFNSDEVIRREMPDQGTAYAVGKSNEWTCKWVESKRNKLARTWFLDRVEYPCGKNGFCRGTMLVESVSFPLNYEHPELSERSYYKYRAHSTKLVYWHQNGLLYTERFTSTPDILRPVTHTGRLRRYIEFTEKIDIDVMPRAVDAESVPPEILPIQRQAERLFDGWYKLSVFRVADFVNIVPSERLLYSGGGAMAPWQFREICLEKGIDVDEALSDLGLEIVWVGPAISAEEILWDVVNHNGVSGLTAKLEEVAEYFNVDINDLVWCTGDFSWGSFNFYPHLKSGSGGSE